jgi:hypothetical protein
MRLPREIAVGHRSDVVWAFYPAGKETILNGWIDCGMNLTQAEIVLAAHRNDEGREYVAKAGWKFQKNAYRCPGR